MALIKSVVNLILKEHGHYKFSGPLLALGVPDVYATPAELKSWLKTYSLPGAVQENAAVSGRMGFVDAKTFFNTLGFRDVTTADIPGCTLKPDIYHDMNQPFPKELEGKFQCVLDPGTTEHVFDVKTCFTNIVNSLAINGVVIHEVPIYSYNGGYFSINPQVLFDFYSINGFEDLKGYIVMWDRYLPYAALNKVYEYNFEALGPRHALADRDQCRYTPHLLFFARKVKKVERLLVPIQKVVYLPQRPKSANPLVSRIKKFILEIVPFQVIMYFLQRSERERSLKRTKKFSFKA
ncbi:MAG: hypothetical protein Q7R35_01465 [Elusimicrobiota bacterium]|nr:hypothetical protein [Elusimicrobiota bacterium]